MWSIKQAAFCFIQLTGTKKRETLCFNFFFMWSWLRNSFQLVLESNLKLMLIPKHNFMM